MALQKENAALLLHVHSLQLQIKELKKIVFGTRAEKFIAPTDASVQQPDMFPDDKLGEHRVVKTIPITIQKKQTALTINHPGRSPLPQM